MPELMNDIDNMVMTINKMMMYINWLTELYNDIRMVVMTLMILPYVHLIIYEWPIVHTVIIACV